MIEKYKFYVFCLMLKRYRNIVIFKTLKTNKMKKNNLRVVLLGITVLLTIFSCSNKEKVGKDNSRYNIVVFLTDDQSINSLGCYGNSVIKTPNIDKLAKNGVMFTNNFSNSSSCSPNRSVILTGLQNHTNGMYGLTNEHPFNFSTFNDVTSLPTILQNAGYSTAIVGKIHIRPKSVYNFDEELATGQSHNHFQMVEASKNFIKKVSKPFFLFYCTTDPHVGGGKVEDSPYKPDRFANLDEGYPGITPIKYSPDEVLVPDYLPDIPETRAELAQYYQAVSRLDQGLGMLIKMLKEEGVYDNTVIIFASDNGHAMPMCKVTLYDPGVHLPLIVSSPNQKNKGLLNKAMVSFVDLAPTILDFAGVKFKPEDFHGRSFKQILETENPIGWDEVYGSETFHLITWYYPRRMVRNKHYKLIRNIAWQLEDPAAREYHSTWQGVIKSGMKVYGKRKIEDCIHHPEFELYDLKQDPYEINNLANSPEYEFVFKDLLHKLDSFQQVTNDPWIVENMKMP